MQILQIEMHARFDEMPMIGDESRQIRRYCVFVNKIDIVLVLQIVFSAEQFGPGDHES